MLEPKIMARLKAEVPSVNERVNWQGDHQGRETPYLIISEVSAGREYSHDGYSKIMRPRWQVSVYGSSYIEAKTAAKEVIAAMEGWAADGIRFAPVAGSVDLYEEDTKLHHIPVDFFIYYDE